MLPAQTSGPYPAAHAVNTGTHSPRRTNTRSPRIMPGRHNQAPGGSKRRTELPPGTTHITSQVSLFYKKLAKVKTQPPPEVEWIDVAGNDGGKAVHQAIIWLDNTHNATSTPGHTSFAAAKENVASAAILLLETNYQF